MYRNQICIFIICFFITPLLYAGGGPKTPDTEQTPKKVSVELQKIKEYSKKALHELETNNNLSAYDSIFSEAISLSEKSWDNSVKLQTKILYLSSIPAGYQNPVLSERINDAEALIEKTKDEKLKYESYLSICHALSNAQGLDITSKVDKAQSYAIKAINYSETHDTESKVKAKLNLSQVYLKQNLEVDAYETLLSTYLILEQYPDMKEKYIMQYQESLYDLFLKVEAYDKAAQAKRSLITTVESKEPVDELALQWQKFDMAFLNYSSGINADLSEDILSIARYAKSHDNTTLMESSLSLLRSYLIDNLNLPKLKETFSNEFKSYLENKKGNNQIDKYVYYTTKAYMAEADNHLDSAEHYLMIAADIAMNQKNQYRKANYLLRQGEFYQRHGSHEKAKEKFRKSLDISNEISFHSAILESGEYLLAYAVDGRQEDYNSAYYYQKLIQDSKEKLNSQAETSRLLLLDLENKEKVAQIKEEQYEVERKNRIFGQYTIILLIMTTFFIIFLATSRLKVRPWVIEMLGFFNFILVFEFIILLIDSKLHDMTHGEPLIMFAVKVVLIIFLYPLHHYMEHVSVKFLKEKKALIAPSPTGMKSVGTSLWPWLFAPRKEKESTSEEEK